MKLAAAAEYGRRRFCPYGHFWYVCFVLRVLSIVDKYGHVFCLAGYDTLAQHLRSSRSQMDALSCPYTCESIFVSGVPITVFRDGLLVIQERISDR